eukprot:763293-Hanusia_phi.AAC.1
MPSQDNHSSGSGVLTRPFRGVARQRAKQKGKEELETPEGGGASGASESQGCSSSLLLFQVCSERALRLAVEPKLLHSTLRPSPPPSILQSWFVG